MLTVSDFQILIKSCSIESRNDPSPKSEVVHETKFSLKISYSTHVVNMSWSVGFTRHCEQKDKSLFYPIKRIYLLKGNKKPNVVTFSPLFHSLFVRTAMYYMSSCSQDICGSRNKVTILRVDLRLKNVYRV